MFKLEALPAKHGDALLLHFGSDQLVVIDGGPATVFRNALQPRLAKIRDDRGLGESQPLDIELMMVSHIDADHITGLLELVRKLRDAKDAMTPAPWRVKRFWLNAFEDTIADGGGASFAADLFAGDLAPSGISIVEAASVRQGRELADILRRLGLDGNKPFNGLVQYGAKKQVTIGDLKLQVIGPNEANLELLRKDWAKKVVEIIKKEKDKEKAAARAADYLDKSPYNLSSIVVLAECDGKTMLLTGDGRGDHTLDELEKAGLLKNGTLRVDLLKLPHHGSSRDVKADYFETILAKHYVISADGNYDNPDLETLEMLSAARPDDDFTIHLTYPFGAFYKKAVGAELKKFFAAEKKSGRKYKVVPRKAKARSIVVAL